MPLSGIHNFSNLQTGFPIRIASGMTNCERIFFIPLCNQDDTYAKRDLRGFENLGGLFDVQCGIPFGNHLIKKAGGGNDGQADRRA
jgi:hypothetical protein